VIILHLLRLDSVLADRDPALEARITAAAIAGQHFNAVQSGHDSTLHTTRVENLIAFECPIDTHE